MPIAAVPSYLGKDFSSASPALRFGMYLPLWGINRRTGQLLWTKSDIDHQARGPRREEREVKRDNKNQALQQACQLSDSDKKAMQALAKRQSLLAQATAHVLTLDAIATAPFTTGLGNEHPLENGFAFISPYGLPYLPGSGIKGVLRQAARELASGEWESAHGWSKDKRYAIQANGQRAELSMLDALFGLEPKDGDTLHVRGALSFWDAIPQVPGDHLHVEVMTPHQSHYYQQKKGRQTGNSISPHDSGQPTPICFLTLPPQTRFVFHVQCDVAHLKRLAPELAENDRWQQAMTAAFEHAFAWLGFGAKTAVGYGAMQSEQQRRREQQAAAERTRQQQEQARAQAAQQLEREAETWEGARLKFNAKNGALSAEKNGQTAIATAVDSPKGRELLANLPAPIQKKVETNQFVRVTARVAKGKLLGVES